jgi:hypothetical protein
MWDLPFPGADWARPGLIGVSGSAANRAAFGGGPPCRVMEAGSARRMLVPRPGRLRAEPQQTGGLPNIGANDHTPPSRRNKTTGTRSRHAAAAGRAALQPGVPSSPRSPPNGRHAQPTHYRKPEPAATSPGWSLTGLLLQGDDREQAGQLRGIGLYRSPDTFDHGLTWELPKVFCVK